MNLPIYVEPRNEELAEKMEKIKSLLRAVERETAFISHTGPMLYAVPAPDDDCISIGNITAIGLSRLSEFERSRLIDLLKEFQVNQ